MQGKLLRQKPKHQQECRQRRAHLGRMWNVRLLGLYFYCSGYRMGLTWERKRILTWESSSPCPVFNLDTHSPGLGTSKSYMKFQGWAFISPGLHFLAINKGRKCQVSATWYTPAAGRVSYFTWPWGRTTVTAMKVESSSSNWYHEIIKT